MTADPYDLGIDPAHTYDEEHWRPSADYPEVTAHRLRRVGDRLEVLTTPPGYVGSPYTRHARIVAVWRHVQRAELRFEDAEVAVHFDLVSRRLVELPGEFRVTVPLARDPRDPRVWVSLLAALAAEGPLLYPALGPQEFSQAPLESAPWTARPDGRSATLRWPAGYGFSRHESAAVERVDCWCAASVVPLLCVALLRPRDPERPASAVVMGYFNPGLAAVDAAVARLRAVLAG